MNRSRRRRPTCMRISRSRRQYWPSSSHTRAASKPASVPTTDYSPSWRRSEQLNYAEWNGANGHAKADSTSTNVHHSGTIRHSSAHGINSKVERRRADGIPDRRAGAHRLRANQGLGTARLAAVELEGRNVRLDGRSGSLSTGSGSAPPSPPALFCKRHTRGYSVI